MAVLLLSPGGLVEQAGVHIAIFPGLSREQVARSFPLVLYPQLLLTLCSDPSLGHPPLGKRQVEKAGEGKKMCGGSQWCELNKRNGGVMVKD